MKHAILFVTLAAMTLLASPARGAEPSSVPWLLGFFSQHATPAPACKAKTCTPAELAVRDEVASIRLQTARAIAEVAYDPTEPPLYRRSPIGRGRTAALLASIAAHETGLQPRLVHGECRPGECDGGKAVGLMQIHPGDFGIRLTTSSALLCTAKTADEDCVSRTELLADPVLTIRVALHIVRGLGLGVYTGEGACEGDAAESRREWAMAWVKSHPPAPDADVMSALQEDADLR
jgi:hypothetical protein